MYPQLISNIVLYVDKNDLYNFCRIGNIYYQVCQERINLEKAIKLGLEKLIKNGNLDYIKLLHKFGKTNFNIEYYVIIDYVAMHGRLEILKWLHENKIGECTTKAMDVAAEYGHLDVIKWLHEHGKEGCTTNAMDFAAH